jgi:hypothetical protein
MIFMLFIQRLKWILKLFLRGIELAMNHLTSSSSLPSSLSVGNRTFLRTNTLPPPPGYVFSQELCYRQIPEEEEEEEEEEENCRDGPIRLDDTIQQNYSIPRNVLVNREDEVSVVSFLSDHTSTTNASHKQQPMQQPASLNNNALLQDTAPNPPRSPCSAGKIHRQSDIIDSPETALEQTSLEASHQIHTDSIHSKKRKKKKTKKKHFNKGKDLQDPQLCSSHLTPSNLSKATSTSGDQRKMELDSSGSTESTSASVTPLSNHAKHEHSSIASQTSPPVSRRQHHTTPKGHSLSKASVARKHRPLTRNNKFSHVPKTTPNKCQESFWYWTLLHSFLLIFYQGICQRIASRDQLFAFLKKSFFVLEILLLHALQLIFHTSLTFAKFLILLHKLAIEEVLANQDGFFCYAFCTSYSQIVNYLTKGPLSILPRWLPQVAWICAVSFFCLKRTATTPITLPSLSYNQQSYQDEHQLSSNTRNKNNHVKYMSDHSHKNTHKAFQNNGGRGQIIMSIVRGEKVSKARYAQLYINTISDVSSNDTNISAPEQDLAVAKNSLPPTMAAVIPDFINSQEADYFNAFSKFSHDLLRVSWIILVVILSLETVISNSSSVILELSASEQILIGYSLAVIKMGYISSLISWLSLSVQVLVVIILNNLGRDFFLLDHFLLVIGLATLHLIQQVADRHAVIVFQECESRRRVSMSSISDPITILKMKGARYSMSLNAKKLDFMTLLQVIAILGMELCKLLLPEVNE